MPARRPGSAAAFRIRGQDGAAYKGVTAMRPFKHVAGESQDGHGRYQDIVGIDLARFRAPWGDVPVVATAEADRITLYYWDDLRRGWSFFEREHEALSFDGDTPAVPGASSRRAALT